MGRLSFPASLAFVLLVSGAVRAQVATLTWRGEAAPVAGQQYVYELEYTLSGITGSGVSNVQVAVDLPSNLAVKDIALPAKNGVPAFLGGCTRDAAGSGSPNYDPWEYSCLFTAAELPATDGSVSGLIRLTLLYRRFAFVDDTPLTLSATFDSDQADAADTHPVSVQAVADVNIWVSDINAYWTYTPGSYDPDGAGTTYTAMSGMYYRFPVRFANQASATLRPGALTDVPFGQNTWFVGVERGTSWEIDGASTAVAGSKGGTLVLRYDARVGTSGPIDANHNPTGVSEHTTTSTVTVFIACGFLGANLNVLSDPDDVPFSYEVSGLEDKLPLGVGVEDTEHTDFTTVPTNWSSLTSTPTYAQACGSPGSSGKYSSPTYDAPLNESVTWTVIARPATGDPLWTNALIVDPVPSHMTFINAAMAENAQLSRSFAVYFCRVPALAQTSFDFTAFSGYRTANTCRGRAEFYNSSNQLLATTPWPIGETTHVAAHAPTWSDNLSSADTTQVMHAAQLNLTMRLDMTTPDETEITNVARLTGSAGGTSRGPYDLSDPIRAQGEANPRIYAFVYNGVPLVDTVFAPGEAIRFAFSFDRYTGVAMFQPTIHVEFPRGIRIDTVQFLDSSNACADLPGAAGAPTVLGPVLDDNGTPGDPLDDFYEADINVLNDTAPYSFFTDGCSSAAAQDWARRAFWVTGQVLPTYPHVSSDTLTMTATLTVQNPSNVDVTNDGLPANQRRASVSLNVITAAEMRVRVEAACSPERGPAFVTYDYAMDNTAGTHLHGATLVMAVPKVGSPAGNTIDTTFVSVSAPGAGETLGYSVDGGANWSATLPGDLDDVTHVRLVRAQLDAYQSRTVRLVSSHAASVPIGTQILGAATLDADELAPIPNSEYLPWTTGDCPARLTVFKFYDGAAPIGSYGDGDEPLSGWTFEASGPTLVSGVTNADGEVVLEVLPGTYVVSEALPNTATMSWSPTTAGGASQSIAIGLEPTYRLEFGNVCACDDGNSCTDDACAYPGTCTFTPTPGEPCDEGNQCSFCDASGACVAQDIACGEPDACELPGVCDPATGGCLFEPVPCTPLPIYVVVNGPDGQPAGTVRCELGAGHEVSCAMNGAYVAIDPTLWCPGE